MKSIRVVEENLLEEITGKMANMIESFINYHIKVKAQAKKELRKERECLKEVVPEKYVSIRSQYND